MDAGVDAAPKTEPDYDRAFPQDQVKVLSITVSGDNWQAMMDDMTSMLGEFGSGGGGGPQGDGGMPPNGDGGMPPMDGGGPPMGDGGPPPGFEGGMPPSDDGGMPPGDLEGGMPPMSDGGQGGGMPGGMTDLIPRTPIYVDCDVSTSDLTLHHVGIRFKGNSSLAMAWQQGIYKMPLRLTFDELEDQYPETKNQRFYGFKYLGLSNGQSDRSLLRDKIGTEVFANAGLPAPATAFYRVYVDHGNGPVYFGLYTGIELPQDDSFLDRSFSGHKGNLYKPDGVGARWQTYDESTLGKENHEDEADFSDAKALYDALHADRTDAAKWRAGLEASLDVDGFLHWLALNTVIQDWDSSGQMAHNYYVYADPGASKRFRWIPWDHSYAFTADRALSLALSEVTEEWPLIRYLLDDSVYAAKYRSYVAQAIEKEYEPVSATARFQAAHDLIKPYVVGADGEIASHTFLSSSTDFDTAFNELIARTQARQTEVNTWLGK